LNRLEHYEDGLKVLLQTLSPEHLETLFSIEEGLENRLHKTPFNGSLADYLEALKTPRYTYAKLRRSLMHVVCQTPKHFQAYTKPPYVRVLGMNAHGQKHLNAIKKTCALPLITKLTRERHPLLDYELKVTRLYALKTSAKLYDKEFAPCYRTTLKDPLISAIMT
jgi:predicted nucleotidyltransferase